MRNISRSTPRRLSGWYPLEIRSGLLWHWTAMISSEAIVAIDIYYRRTEGKPNRKQNKAWPYFLCKSLPPWNVSWFSRQKIIIELRWLKRTTQHNIQPRETHTQGDRLNKPSELCSNFPPLLIGGGGGGVGLYFPSGEWAQPFPQQACLENKSWLTKRNLRIQWLVAADRKKWSTK